MSKEEMRDQFEARWGQTNDEQGLYFIPELNTYGCEMAKNRSMADRKSSAWYYFQLGQESALAATPKADAQPVAWIKPDVLATLTKDECCYAFGEQSPKGNLVPLFTRSDAGEVDRLNTVVEQQKNLIASLRAELAAMCRLWPEDMADDGSGRIGWQQHVAQTVIRARSALPASAEQAKPEQLVWISMEDLPEHEVGARYRMILDDVPQECTEQQKEGSKRWFLGESNGAYPIDEIQAWLPIAESTKDDDWHMNPCRQGHRDVGAAGGVAHCYTCDEKITAATTQEAFEQWNATHPATQTKCKVHRQYKAIRKPTADCEACRKMWSEKQEASAEPANKEG